jgi:DNA-binding HxlR family transcriptional regulator/putative sterol carrier protein
METSTAPRTYNDPCGIARALDLVGERWALLVVRELLLGPKRFGQLRRGLREASPNVLSQRLRELESAGVVHRYRLGPPADVVVYELTERGYALEPVLLELGRWGSRTPITSQAELGTDALMIALKTRFEPARAAGLEATYDVRLGDDRFSMTVRSGQLQVVRGPAGGASATVVADPATFRSVIFGRLRLAHALEAGKLHVEGDRSVLRRLIALFSTCNQG